MRSTLAAIAAALLIVPAAIADQLTLGSGGIASSIEGKDFSEDASELFVELEYQVPMDADGRKWVGVAPSLGGSSNSKGMAIRAYLQTGDAYPGLGLAMYRVDSDDVGALSADTWFVGAELLLEFSVPVGDTDLPATALVGVYPSVAGDGDATLVRFGVKVAPDLLD